MRKLTAQHKVAITNLMFATTAKYINTFCTDRTDSINTNMYTDDIIHNITALKTFNKNNNVQELHDAIMQQDTLVREYYIKVLRYIETNKLIEADCFCCT
jgi:hypothetical protein